MTFPYSRFTHFRAWHSLFKIHPFLGLSCFVGLDTFIDQHTSFFLIWQNPQILGINTLLALDHLYHLPTAYEDLEAV